MANTPKRQRPMSPVRPEYMEDSADRDILLELARKERRVAELKEQLATAESELSVLQQQVMRSSSIKEINTTQRLFDDMAAPPLDTSLVLNRLAEGSKSIFSAVFNDLKELGAATIADHSRSQAYPTESEVFGLSIRPSTAASASSSSRERRK
ncbi:hypothetical protein BCR37DRAFT_197305 [Protomyces lactucae-debilis]|uniref:Uncharacterized protein n=1 Tax=Protomyces lactucae-debilis TaxID=2754530 RepID=A0A1Y2ETJ8_PROLT|nr:uncharacterized protein BCR37DRAFT_197305 [Protomyces lactucae-debilis]ORY74857.1 hypothetical protein BCR37DRAFT_197305 [Protomyces lactucae-debilis]